MADITPGSLLDKVIKEVPNFFKDGIDQLVTGEGEYIRAGEPAGQIAKIGQAVARSYCRQYGADPSAARFGNAARIENSCRPYLDDLDPGEGPAISVPFSGGQCSGTVYRVSGTYRDEGTGGNPSSWGPNNVTGPVTGVVNRPPTGGGAGRRDIWVTSSGGSDVRVFTDAFKSQAGPNVITTITLLSGGPDTCGNPPPVVTQPRPIADPTGPSFRFNPSGDVNIDIDVDVLPDGTINVDIGTGPINVDPFPPDSDGGGGGDGDGPPGDVGEADEDGAEDADEDGNASGCAGENQVLGGLKVDITGIPDSARQYAPGIYRGAGYIYMGAEGKLDQDFGGSMMRDGQFYLPEKNNLTCWEVQANLGYRLRVTPHYRTLEEDGSTTP